MFFIFVWQVAPLLFEAFETVPHLTQISYIGMEGLFFSYCSDHDQALAIYYVHPVNNETGKVFGEAIISNCSISTSWIKKSDTISN
jgi:hypothetical protein